MSILSSGGGGAYVGVGEGWWVERVVVVGREGDLIFCVRGTPPELRVVGIGR